MKGEARDAKKFAKDSRSPSTVVTTMDLQSVLLCPRLQAAAFYYHMKLQVRNFIVYRLNDGDVELHM